MALSASILAGLIQTNLSGAGANGSNLSVFCMAIAQGVVNSIVGKAFTTTDVGLIPGTGVGVGVGISGLSSSSMKSVALSEMSSQGSNAGVLMQSIMDAVVQHLSSAASLASTHTPVFSGVGTVVIGSIAVTDVEMGSNIDSALAGAGANGSNRTNLANAIGKGIADNILAMGTGTVTITGSPSGIPVPGVGAGVGVIS